MCGIGFFGPFQDIEKDREVALTLFDGLVQRGKDGAGFVLIHPKDGLYHHFRDFELDKVREQLEKVKLRKGSYILLHTRARPISELIHEQEPSIELLQPIVKDNIVVSFNGIIENDTEFRDNETVWVDTFAICKYLSGKKQAPLKGSYSFIYVDLKFPDLVQLVKGNQPLYLYENPETGQVIASSLPVKGNKLYEITIPVATHKIIKIDNVMNKAIVYSSNYPIGIENSSPYPKPNKHKCVVLCSGGLDSCVVACELVKECKEVYLLNFDYNQPAAKQEWHATVRLSEHLRKLYPNKRIQVVQFKLPFLTELAKCSSIFNETPKGISAVETLSRWIPARNLIFLSIAVGFAESIGAGLIGYGGNLEEACVFPDNTVEAIEKFNKVIDWFTSKPGIMVVNPIANCMKVDIVKKAIEYGVYDISWSCDRDGEEECGECEGCILKRKAYELVTGSQSKS